MPRAAPYAPPLLHFVSRDGDTTKLSSKKRSMYISKSKIFEFDETEKEHWRLSTRRKMVRKLDSGYKVWKIEWMERGMKSHSRLFTKHSDTEQAAPTYTSVFFFIERLSDAPYLELSNFKIDARRKRSRGNLYLHRAEGENELANIDSVK